MRYLIPIAAEHDLFPRSEFYFPKPLIEVAGKTMISRVISGIETKDPEASFIFVVRETDCTEFSLDSAIRLSTQRPTEIIQLSKETRGSLCSCLMAIEHVDDEHPLVICNGDQVLDINLREVFANFSSADAGVITFDSVHPRWSFARVDDVGVVTEVAEKRVISRSAIAGFYYFRKGSSFIEAAKLSILKSSTLNQNFYISPVVNEVILQGGTVREYKVDEGSYLSFYSPKRLAATEKLLQHQEQSVTRSDDSMPIQYVIPMAGLGSRFSEAGYVNPKPFIDVDGAPMICRVIENLRVPGAKFTLIARDEHIKTNSGIVKSIRSGFGAEFVGIDSVTEGAACTVLRARRYLDPDAPLVIANCDQIVDIDFYKFIDDAITRNLDGSILTFRDPTKNKKWSFARIDDNMLVTEVREKVPVSDIATVGVYYFKSAQHFYNACIDMISCNDRVNNEFYVCPVYNYMISSGARVGIYDIPEETMHGIGTPEDLGMYLEILRLAPR